MPSEQLRSSIASMRPIAPVPPRSARRVVGTVLLVLGLVAAVVGLGGWLWPSIGAFGDPLLPGIGFRGAPDGGIVVVVGPRTAAETTGVTVHARGRAIDPPYAEPPVLWQIERVGPTAPRWDGEVELGEVPQGFAETVAPVDGWRAAAADVRVDNGCSFGSGPLPRGVLRSDEVVVDGDDVESLKDFTSDSDDGFSPCLEDDSPRTDPRGLAVSAAGSGLVVLGGVLRRRRR